MRWIQAPLTLIVLLFGFALGNAKAAEERPVHLDSAPADAACGLVHGTILRPDSHQGPGPSFNRADPFDGLNLSRPFLADTPEVGRHPSLDRLVPARPFLAQIRLVAGISRCRGPVGWPATAAGRLTWLQRFLF